ncbi:hypothetical protein BGW42_000782 [Actinomortierella wolfii]|nr:hypothetical protein BGW42_000782 [Actinomortierella wolfii]
MNRPSALRSQHLAGPRLTTYGSKKKKDSNVSHPVLSHWERMERERIKKLHDRRDGGAKSGANVDGSTTIALEKHEDQDDAEKRGTGTNIATRDKLSISTIDTEHITSLAVAGGDGPSPPHLTTQHEKASNNGTRGGAAPASSMHTWSSSIPSNTATITKATASLDDQYKGFANAIALRKEDRSEIFHQAVEAHDMIIERFDEECDNHDGDEDEDEDDEVLFRAPSLEVLQKLRSTRPSSSPVLHSALQHPLATTIAVPSSSSSPLSSSSSQGRSGSQSSQISTASTSPSQNKYNSNDDTRPKSTTTAIGSGVAMEDGCRDEESWKKRMQRPRGGVGDAVNLPARTKTLARAIHQEKHGTPSEKPQYIREVVPSTSSSSSPSPMLSSQRFKHDDNNPFLGRGSSVTNHRNHRPSRDDDAAYQPPRKATEGLSDGDSPEVTLGKRMSSFEITPKRLLAKQRRMATEMEDSEEEYESSANAALLSPSLKAAWSSSADDDPLAKLFEPASPLASFITASRHRDALGKNKTLASPPLATRVIQRVSNDVRGTSIPTVAKPTLQDLVSVCDQWLCMGTTSASEAVSLDNLPTFNQFVAENPVLQTTISKVGEASYSEVYTAIMPDISPPKESNAHQLSRHKDGSDPTLQEDRHHDKVVLKVVPFLNQTQRSGPRGSTMTVLSDIYREVVMSTRIVRGWDGFMSSMGAIVVKGKYPKCFLDAWDKYKADNGTESVRPDLEHYDLVDWKQAWTILTQLGLLLATREQEPFRFEHRDLHWGNILVTETNERSISLDATLAPSSHHEKKHTPGHSGTVNVPTFGIRAQIIDYTLARVNTGLGKQALYMDLEDDQDLFEGKGDFQFDIYRSMQRETNKDWAGSYPRTNVLWMYYLCKKLVEDKKLTKPKRRLKRMPHQEHDPLFQKDEYWFYNRVMSAVQLLEKDYTNINQSTEPADQNCKIPPPIQSVRALLDVLLAL